MANLEALFDHEGDKKKIEEYARNEYFHKIYVQTHKFVDDLIEQLQFLNKKDISVIIIHDEYTDWLETYNTKKYENNISASN